jgi:hypothetical protein
MIELRHATTAVTQGFGHRAGGVGAEAVALGDRADAIWHCSLLLRRGVQP